MGIRIAILLLLALAWAGCSHTPKKKPESVAKKNAPKKEATIYERWVMGKYDLEKSSAYSGKPYETSSTQGLREYRTGGFTGSKAAPLKSYNSKSFLGLGAFGSKNKEFSTDAAHLPNSQMPGTNNAYNSKPSADQTKGYAAANAATGMNDRSYGTRTTTVAGAASKETLSEEGKALQRKVDKGEMTLDQVKELLNKPR
ncbi:MAG: hypothetical protein ABI615_00180 [Chthoniobacterales bacterium]